MTSGPGRPRHTRPLRPGSTGREQILDAAAELFTVQGFAQTSTRAIAEAVGIRQASLYHHFATKDDILDALLSSTVIPVLPVADALLRHEVTTPDQAAARLYALALHDGGQLAAAPWNVGVLYLAPELRQPRFLPFQAARERLPDRMAVGCDDGDAKGGCHDSARSYTAAWARDSRRRSVVRSKTGT